MMASRYFTGYVYNEMLTSIVSSLKIDLERRPPSTSKYMYMYHILEFILDVIGLSCYQQKKIKIAEEDVAALLLVMDPECLKLLPLSNIIQAVVPSLRKCTDILKIRDVRPTQKFSLWLLIFKHKYM